MDWTPNIFRRRNLYNDLLRKCACTSKNGQSSLFAKA